MSTALSNLADNLSEIYKKTCPHCKNRKIENSEYWFFKLNNDNDKLVYKSGECKNEWEEPFEHKLIENFPSVYELCEGDLDKFILLLKKGAYPYEYIDSWEKFEKTTLPNKKYFHSELN